MPSETETLQALMQTAEVKSYRALAEKAGVSRWQVQQLRSGNIGKMRVNVLTPIATVLNLSLPDLLQHFSKPTELQPHSALENPIAEHQNPPSDTQVQTTALQTLETWLTQWPTIAKRAQAHPELSATKLLPFIRPVEQLMAEWNVAPIAAIDEHVPYDPIYHQLTKGTANPGDLVQVTHTGQTHQGKLLHRAKVKPV